MKNCPECLSSVPDEAQVCAACGRRIVGRQCPECAEMARESARKCPACGHDFAREQKVSGIEPFSARACLLPTIFFRGRLIPQEIHLTPEKIVIRTWGILWLSHTDEEIPWAKIAGYHYHSGWFWDRIEIQTRGQQANHILGLPKSGGGKIRDTLERMKE
jgi:hypothetical protein